MSVISEPKCSEETAAVSEDQPLPEPHYEAQRMLTEFMWWRLECHYLTLWIVKANIGR